MRREDIQNLVRPNIRSLAPYSTARDEFEGNLGTFLDANESPYPNKWNRYPDPRQKALKAIIAELKDIEPANLFLGNGSDEAIDLIFRIFCTPGKDNAIAISPSYGMYRVAAETNDIKLAEFPLEEDFSLNEEKLLAQCNAGTKVIFLCSPNNPSGNTFPTRQIEIILERFNGIVALDEAYIDFADVPGFAKRVDEYPNLIVLQTMSKARGMASLRLGLAISNSYISSLFAMVKYPYNINGATQLLAMKGLERDIEGQVREVVSEREMLTATLPGFKCVEKVYPSQANFLLVKVSDADALYDYLIESGIIVRNRTNVNGCANCLRITVGLREENKKLLEALKAYDNGAGNGYAGCASAGDKAIACVSSGNSQSVSCGRCAHIVRKSSETDIEISIALDGGGESKIDTGLKFLDHMLNQLVHHGGITLNLTCKGDLEVDEHHSMEDIGIALGTALKEALGEKKGIERYGFVLPMDECAAAVLLDFGGRSELVWKVEFTREWVGDVPTEMFKHFFKSLSSAACCNIYVEAKGENNHHLAEAVFKAFARALKQAVREDPFNYALPSSKGIL